MMHLDWLTPPSRIGCIDQLYSLVTRIFFFFIGQRITLFPLESWREIHQSTRWRMSVLSTFLPQPACLCPTCVTLHSACRTCALSLLSRWLMSARSYWLTLIVDRLTEASMSLYFSLSFPSFCRLFYPPAWKTHCVDGVGESGRRCAIYSMIGMMHVPLTKWASHSTRWIHSLGTSRHHQRSFNLCVFYFTCTFSFDFNFTMWSIATHHSLTFSLVSKFFFHPQLNCIVHVLTACDRQLVSPLLLFFSRWLSFFSSFSFLLFLPSIPADTNVPSTLHLMSSPHKTPTSTCSNFIKLNHRLQRSPRDLFLHVCVHGLDVHASLC